MKVAYLLSRFPALSETFVQSEIEDHLAAGLWVDVYSFLPGDLRVRTPMDRRLFQRVNYLQIPPSPVGKVVCLMGSAIADAYYDGGGWRTARLLKSKDFRQRIWAYHAARAWAKVPQHYDVVHCHFGTCGVRAAALKSTGAISCKLVVTFHGADLSRNRGRVLDDYYKVLFQVGDLFLPINMHWASKLESLGCPREKIIVHHMGVDVENLRRPAQPNPSRGRVGLCSVGRFVEKKGHIYALRAFASVRARRPDINLSLDFVGDGPLLADTRRAASELGVTGSVTFHGAVSHERALEIIAESDLFILPSITASDGEQEGIPVVLMEAMALGLPVLSTHHSGIPELVHHGSSGLLCPERDAAGLAANLEQLASNPQSWSVFGASGRETVLREFNRRSLGQKLRGHYVRLTQRAGAPPE